MKPREENSSVTISVVQPNALNQSAGSGRLYAVLDSCNQPLVLAKAGERADAMLSLYQNEAAEDFADFAPYLFVADQELVGWIDEALAGTFFGIYLESDLDLADLRLHLRELLMVDGEDDRRLYFRFYDPRVIGGFLDTAEQGVASRFFGPIKSVYFVDQEEQLSRITLNEKPGQSSQAVHSKKIKVTREHMLAMAERSKHLFGKRLHAHLTEELPLSGVSISGPVLQTKIDNGLFNSERYALTTEADIAKYIELLCLGFPESTDEMDPAEVRELMLDRRLEVQERLKQLEAMVSVSTMVKR